MARSWGDVIKKAFTKDVYTVDREEEMMKCMLDPIYFMETYIRVQTTTVGSVPFKLYDFQKDLINAFHNHNSVIGLTARQMGKCHTNLTSITKDGEKVKANSIINLSTREKVVDWLEKKLIEYSKD